MSARPKNVLVVEDESVLRASMVAGLGKLKDVQAWGVGTMAEAIASLDQRPPQVVVSDLDLPDGLGVQLIGELAKREIRAPILFVTAYRAAYGSLIPPHAAVEVLEKPVSLETIRNVVRERLGEDDSPPSPFAVADYVQLSCMGRHSVVIEVEAKGQVGRIEIVQGDLWSAHDPSGAEGETAFRKLAFRRDGKIQCSALEEAPTERNIKSSWESVLMEAARVHDEEARASRPVFDLEAHQSDDELGGLADLGEIVVPAAPSAARAEQKRVTTLPSMGAVRPEAVDTAPVEVKVPDPFDVLYDQAIAALMQKDYRTAATAFGRARELRPDDPKANANLTRLKDMGFGPDS